MTRSPWQDPFDDRHRFCVAPMMDGTDRHCRYFHRRLSRHARLYTEMVVAEAVLHGDRQRLLGFDSVEHPVALQLGGSDPRQLAAATRIGADFGYDEVNLNVGCPSDRVQSGAFGACLMKTPELVADCVKAMLESSPAPVTVKCRIGVDEQEPTDALFRLVDATSAVGVRTFIVHARKAWLQGLSPKDNREIPPLDYGLVRRLKSERPDLRIILNGGLTSIASALQEMRGVDGVMLGRAPYAEPFILTDVDKVFFDDGRPAPTRADVVRAMSVYVRRQADRGVRPNRIVRHMLGLYHGQPRARLWRRLLSENGAATPVDILNVALELVEPTGTSRSPTADYCTRSTV